MGILGAISSLVFLLLLLADPAGIIISLVVFPFAGVGAILFLIRRSQLKKKGIDYKTLMKKVPESVNIEEGIPSKIERLASEKD